MQAEAAFAKTDSDGRFQFDHLPSAPYWMSVVHAGYKSEVVTFEVRDRIAPMTLRLSRARPMVIRIEDAPVAALGTTIRWMLHAFGSPSLLQDGEAVLSPTGELRGDAPPPGRYILQVSETTVLSSLHGEVVVGDEGDTTVVLRVAAGASISGVVRDSLGRPISKASIRVADSPPATTDSEGHFTITRVSAGAHRQVWIILEHANVVIGNLDVPSSGEASADLRVNGSAVITAVIPGLSVAALYRGDDPGEFMAQAWADAKGEVRIPFLGAGTYHLKAFRSDAPQLERSVELADGQQVNLGEILLPPFPIVPAKVTLPVGVNRPASIDVVVQAFTDGRGGPGVQPGRIEFDGAGQAWLKGIPEGEFVVLISLPGAEPWRGTISVRSGAITPIEIELRAR